MHKNILITGATSGFGLATARIFAKNGHRLIITGRREDRLKKLALELKAEYNADVLPLVFDVRDSNAVQSAADNLSEEWRNIDVLGTMPDWQLGLDPSRKVFWMTGNG